MLDILSRLNACIQRVLEKLLTLLFALLCFSVFFQIILRYFFGRTILQLEDLARYLFPTIVFLGTAWNFRNYQHVAIGFLFHWLPQKVARYVDVGQKIISLLLFVIIFVRGIEFTWGGMGQIAMQLRIPLGYFYCVVPVSAFVTILYIVEILFNKDLDVSVNQVSDGMGSTLLPK
ncbi:MAG: TRAP transporter small permease [Limnochordia bacterium]|jgi:TRAP-type C4-dicarboxylate transport system permease small subunit